MEDASFVDYEFIEETVWEYVAVHGGAAVSMLWELAETAECISGYGL